MHNCRTCIYFIFFTRTRQYLNYDFGLKMHKYIQILQQYDFSSWKLLPGALGLIWNTPNVPYFAGAFQNWSVLCLQFLLLFSPCQFWRNVENLYSDVDYRVGGFGTAKTKSLLAYTIMKATAWNMTIMTGDGFIWSSWFYI